MTMIKVSKFDGDSGIVRDVFAQFPSGVAVLATHSRGEKHALVASSFMVGVSLNPCLVAVAVQKTSTTWELIKDAGVFGVSIFGKGQGDLTRKLASKDRTARFNEVAIEVDDSGAIFIEDAAMWLQCSTHIVSEAGDHWLIILEVKKLGVGENEALVWHGRKFRELAEVPSIVGA